MLRGVIATSHHGAKVDGLTSSDDGLSIRVDAGRVLRRRVRFHEGTAK